MTTITGLSVSDVRAPTSRTLAGSDAVHADPDYSAAYVVLHTDGIRTGHGLTFTIGRGTEVVCAAVEALRDHVVGLTLGDVVADFAGFWRSLTNDSQLRWLGPEKGVIHLATAAIVNAVWDLWAKLEGKPVWKLVADLTPEQFVSCIDFRYLSDVLTRDDALDDVRALEPGKASREAELLRDGVPAYITSAGWLGYSEAKVRRLCREALADGWGAFKMKVGIDPAGDARRAAVMREEIGADRDLMADANQVWDVPAAISWTEGLAEYRLRWIEEPTSPDDVLGHAAIRRALAPGESVSRPASTARTVSCSSSCCRQRPSTTARSTRVDWVGSTKCWPCCSSRRASAFPCVRTPAASVSANTSSTSRRSTTSS